MTKKQLKRISRITEDIRAGKDSEDTIKSLWESINKGFAPLNHKNDNYGKIPQ